MIVAALPAAAQDFDPATLDLPALVECRATIPDYNAFGFWLSTEPDAASRLGWREVQSSNMFLREFRLDRPLAAFGRTAATVAFTPSGPMAVFDGEDAAKLATVLGLSVFHASGDKFLAEKVIFEGEDK